MKIGIMAKYGSKVSNENIEDSWGLPPADPEVSHPVGDTQPIGIDVSPDNNLFDQLHTISSEAMMMGNISNYFGRKVNTLSVAIQEGFKYLTTYNYDPMETLHPLQLDNFVSTLDFDDHRELKVPQPNGFKGELLPYTVTLLYHARTMQKVLNDVIRPAAARFGHYLTIPLDRAERRDFEYGITISEDREKLVKEESKLFTGTRVAQTQLGTLFNSFSDVIAAERNLQEINGILNGGGTDEMKKAVTALVTVANALVRRIAEDKANKTSNEFAKMIADQLNDAARWTEWFAATLTRIIETNNVLYAIEKQILDI